MRLRLIAALAALSVLSAARASADEGPGDCLGIDFNVLHPVTIARIIADAPRVQFVKSAFEDKACPADGDACAASASLAPGDLVLVGKSHGNYTCVSYQSAADRKPQWTSGWLPSASMTPVKPSAAAARADWIGTWVHAGGRVRIRPARNGRVAIHGVAVYPAVPRANNGVIDAVARPANGLLQFADDGRVPFAQAAASATCLMRMQRIEELLVVEDNKGCGGGMVTFTGFYRKE